MKEKQKDYSPITHFSTLAIISGIASGLTFSMGGMATCLWRELFSEGKTKLPTITYFSTHYGYLVPLICCLFSILCIVIAKKRTDDMGFLWRLFTIIVAIEIFSLALFSWFNLYPIILIDFRLM